MDIPWGSDAALKFITNVGLITSDGPHGQNIMAAEWTHHVSYQPGMIVICPGPDKATLANIRATKKFGVSIASVDQSVMASVSGSVSGKGYDKIAALKELGFTFHAGKKTGLPMPDGAALSVECTLHKEITLGDHVTLVGEVVSVTASQKEPLAYHNGQYWQLNAPVEKPAEKERAHIDAVVEKHRKK